MFHFISFLSYFLPLSLFLLISSSYSFIPATSSSSSSNLSAGYWTPSITAVSDQWSDISSSSSGEIVYAVRSSSSPGGIYYSLNYGQNFFLTTAPFKYYQSITCNSTGGFVAAVANDNMNSLIISRDRGATWTLSTALPNCQCWVAISMRSNGRTLIAVGNMMDIYYSITGGVIWESTVNNPSFRLPWTDVHVSVNGYVLASTNNSGLFISSTGVSWGTCRTSPVNILDGWTSVSITTVQDQTTLLAINDQLPGGVFISYSTLCSFTQLTSDSLPALNFSHGTMSVTATHLVLSTASPTSSGSSTTWASNDTGLSWLPTANSPPLCSDLSSNDDGSLVFATDQLNGIAYLIPGSKAPGPPTLTPTLTPSLAPTAPTLLPTGVPTSPSLSPTLIPSLTPSTFPTSLPSPFPTPLPSSQPTGLQWCPKGTYLVLDGEEAVLSEKESVKGEGGEGFRCVQCPTGTYSNTKNATSCEDCPYPTTTHDTGSTSCPAISLHPPLLLLYVLGSLTITVFVLLIATLSPPSHHIPLFLILIVPLFDVLTDLLYLLTSTYYSSIFFLLSSLLLSYPFLVFSYRFISLGAFPMASCRRMIWLGYSSSVLDQQRGQTRREEETEEGRGVSAFPSPSSHSISSISPSSSNPAPSAPPLQQPLLSSPSDGDHVWYPTIYSRRFSLVFPPLSSHHTIFHLLLELLNWIIALFLQLLTCLLVPSCWLLWFLFGVYLESTKLIHLTSVWNFWFLVWTSTTDFHDTGGGGEGDGGGGGILDTHTFNYSILVEFFIETFPQLILQGLNNSLMHSWTSHYIGIISFGLSCVMSFNVAYRYLYHSQLQSTPVLMKDIPIHSLFLQMIGQAMRLDSRQEEKKSPTPDPGGDMTMPGTPSSSSSPASISSKTYGHGAGGNEEVSVAPFKPYKKQIQRRLRQESNR
jgi:hypothetical protein